MNRELNQDDNHKSHQHQLTHSERQILFSPLRLVAILVLCIFTMEFIVHYLLLNSSIFSPDIEILLDSFLLSFVLCPILFFLLFRPLKHLVVRYQINENRLRGHKEHLEQEVKARTAELDSVIQRFGALSDHLESVREEERLAISREIHDEMGQTLTAFKLDLSWIEHKFMPEKSELIGRFNAMRSSLDLLITKAQDLSAELRPPLLDNLGLAAAIDWQAREFKRRCGIEFNLLLIEDITVQNKQTGTAMMRILQEALTNIARHSKATEVSISLCRSDNNDLVLEIFDNGCGISENEIDAPQAFGVMGMQERARLCHGELSIKGVSGEGTTIRLEIPHIVGEGAN
ncbi:MAG: sensor histidine kinase [Desulfuromonadaceae bacterium]|nr:sensor histidine kinase [Desulfuromonadaceae bacterium]